MRTMKAGIIMQNTGIQDLLNMDLHYNDVSIDIERFAKEYEE